MEKEEEYMVFIACYLYVYNYYILEYEEFRTI